MTGALTAGEKERQSSVQVGALYKVCGDSDVGLGDADGGNVCEPAREVAFLEHAVAQLSAHGAVSVPGHKSGEKVRCSLARLTG